MVLTTTVIVTRIAVAVGLGVLLGLERTLAGKTAGMRTYAMVSLSSSLFVIISEVLISNLSNPLIASPVTIPSAIITGIGFLGAGLVIFKEKKIQGLTTAAGLWLSAGVGIACGFGMYLIASLATVAALVIFTLFWFIENILKKFSYNTREEIEEEMKE